jgi:hypothetical protein
MRKLLLDGSGCDSPLVSPRQLQLSPIQYGNNYCLRDLLDSFGLPWTLQCPSFLTIK